MKYNIMDENMNIVLDELAKEYKELLVSYVMDEKQEIDVSSLSTADLIRADMIAKAPLRETMRERRRKKMNLAVIMAGTIYTLVGLIIILFNDLLGVGNYDFKIIGLFVCFVGIILSFYALLVSELSKSRRIVQKSTVTEYFIMNLWMNFERAIREAVGDENEKSLNACINVILDKRIITYEDVKTIDEMRMLRNKVAHGMERVRRDKQKELVALVEQFEKIIAKIEDGRI